MKTTRAVSAEFRIRQTTQADQSVFVRAQSILDAHSVLCPSTGRAVMDAIPLTPEEIRILKITVARASRVAALYPNNGVEVSPYIKSLLRLED